MSDLSIVIDDILSLPDPGWREYHLVIFYEGRQALLALPVETGLNAGEPGTKLCRRELSMLANALTELAQSNNGIFWQQ